MNLEEFKKMFRFYMGRHRIFVTDIQKNKAMVIHLEEGYVGNKTEGYKKVERFDMDITLVRFCRKKKKEDDKHILPHDTVGIKIKRGKIKK